MIEIEQYNNKGYAKKR